MSTPIILDCDPGHDDAVAILLALGSPRVQLLGITTCFGNCDVSSATMNALKVLELAGRTDIPVARGAESALSEQQILGNYVHGATGLDGPELPEPDANPVEQSAVQFLYETLKNSAQKVTLVVTGPMTNIGQLLQNYPEAVNFVREIVFMGGSTERGNHTPTAEFNTFADPEALDVVLQSGLPIKMVGLNLTHQALATPEVVAEMKAMPHELGQVCADWMGFFGDSYSNIWEFDAPPVHDPCTIVGLIDPETVAWRRVFMTVELEGKWTRGTTVVDLHDRYPGKEPNVLVAEILDVSRYWEIVLSAIDNVGKNRVRAAAAR